MSDEYARSMGAYLGSLEASIISALVYIQCQDQARAREQLERARAEIKKRDEEFELRHRR